MTGSDISTSSFSIDLNEFSQCITFDKYIFNVIFMNSNYVPISPSQEKDRCLTLVFSPLSEPVVRIMEEFAKLSNLKMGVDIIGEGDLLLTVL